MSITLTCGCGQTLHVKEERAGQEADCPRCGATLRIPDSDANRFTEDPAPPRPPASSAGRGRDSDDELRDRDISLLRLTSHGGPLLPMDADLFAAPPREIGEIRSAQSSLTTSLEPTTMAVRLSIAGVLFAGGLGLGLILAIAGVVAVMPVLIGLAFVAVLLGVGLAGLVFWWTRFSHTCSYIGVRGVAVFHCSGDRDNVTQSDLFLFDDADDLRVAQTRQYVNGGYTGTSYTFTWATRNGESVYDLSGTYQSEVGTPVPTDDYYLALGAEAAWTTHLAEKLDRDIAAGRLVTFRLDGNDAVQLGPSLFILEQGGSTMRLRGRELERITIADGIVKVWQQGGQEGWFTNDGVFQFPFGSLANAKLFIFAVQRLLGNVFA